MARKIKGEDGRVYVEKKRGGCLKWIIGGLIVIIGVGAFMPGEDDNNNAAISTPQSSVAQNVSDSTEVEENVEPEDNVSQEFKNALKKGQSYADTMNMSKRGVYGQLTSEYGEGFPEDAAQYAVDSLNVDWKENALKKAKTYYEGMSMSKDGVYDQLVSDAGEQFTAEEAQYAVDNLE